MKHQHILTRLELTQLAPGALDVVTPIDGSIIASLAPHTAADVDLAIERAVAAFNAWRSVPAPRRGELIRLFGDALRDAKADLGALVTLESGKILQEGLGEVQEMIDICDFAVGLSRQLYGLTMASERAGHSMRETWHPAGVCGVITAFNFPVAPWCWNAALALVCGDPVIWKPSEKTPLSALATQKIFETAVARFGDAPAALSQVIVGASDSRQRAGRTPRCRNRLRNRIDAHGPRSCTESGSALRQMHSGTGRQQCDDRRAVGRSRDGVARHCVLGSRHRRTTLHQPAPADRS